jgi:hypothetical protein
MDLGKPLFGNCCDDLREAMTLPPKRFFRIDDGLLYLTVGYKETEKGPGWFDMAVMFCPFCGAHLQERDDLGPKFTAI